MKTLALAVLFCLPAIAAAQQQKRPMTFADLQAIKRISDPEISPSGKWVLFSVTDVSLEKNTKTNHLWVVPLAGGKEVQLTTGTGESNGRFSPDGKQVMFTADSALQDTPDTSQLWVTKWNEASGSFGEKHQVTNLATGADGGLWAPDSEHFLFASRVYPDCESHSRGPGRFHDEARCNAEKEVAAAKSPLKAQIFDHLLYRHWNVYVGAKHSHIFLGALEGSYPEDLTPASVIGDHEAPTFSLGGPLGYAISPDGREVAYVTNLDKVPAESTNNDIYILQLGAEPSTAKKVSTSPGSDDGPQYSADGKYLAWRSQARGGFESDKFALVLMNRANSVPKSLLPLLELSVDEYIWAPDSSELYFTSASLGEAPLFSLPVDGREYLKVEDPVLRGEYSDIRLSPNGKSLIASRMTVTHPSDLYIFGTDKQPGWTSDPVTRESAKRYHGDLSAGWYPVAGKKLTAMNEAVLGDVTQDEMESFWFNGANGTKVQGFLIRPPNFDPAKKYPLKFLIHGGPQGAWGDAWSYRWNPELFAANGYVVVMINPRGSTGYGQQFTDEVSGDWGGRAYEDLMKGLDYAEAKYPFIDKTRECALGASYGGYMANWILTHTDRFKCIVTHDGMYNPQSAFGTTEELWFNEWEFRPLKNPGAPSSPTASSSAKVGPHSVVDQTHPAHPWDYFNATNDADPFRKYSPMLHIKDAHTPTLVIHGQRDYRLDVSEGFQLFTALQLLGVPSKMLHFPDEGHWVLKPQNSQLWYETVNDWVDRWTHTNKYVTAP